ncbi:hypothetical protein Hanom_Chr11g01064801 [Helianthus anomalus]
MKYLTLMPLALTKETTALLITQRHHVGPPPPRRPSTVAAGVQPELFSFRPLSTTAGAFLVASPSQPVFSGMSMSSTDSGGDWLFTSSSGVRRRFVFILCVSNTKVMSLLFVAHHQ